MPTPTYDLLASSVLGSSASSVSFTSIASTYRDLVLVVNATATSNNLALRFNSSSSAYNWVYVQSNGSTTGDGYMTSQTQLDLTSVSYLTTQRNINISHIMDYSATDKHKMVLTRGNGEYGIEMRLGRWGSTDAITSVEIRCDSGNFSSGSTFYLYGIVS